VGVDTAGVLYKAGVVENAGVVDNAVGALTVFLLLLRLLRLWSLAWSVEPAVI
jgi:hypothetical protein